jgi:hypothetical protein
MNADPKWNGGENNLRLVLFFDSLSVSVEWLLHKV